MNCSVSQLYRLCKVPGVNMSGNTVWYYKLSASTAWMTTTILQIEPFLAFPFCPANTRFPSLLWGCLSTQSQPAHLHYPRDLHSYSQKAPWMSQQQQARLTLRWSDTAWPPLSASEPAVLWEPLRQLTLAVSDADQSGPVVTRWSLRFCGSY